jgi:hypothetical protein
MLAVDWMSRKFRDWYVLGTRDAPACKHEVGQTPWNANPKVSDVGTFHSRESTLHQILNHML